MYLVAKRSKVIVALRERRRVECVRQDVEELERLSSLAALQSLCLNFPSCEIVSDPHIADFEAQSTGTLPDASRARMPLETTPCKIALFWTAAPRVESV